MPMRNIRFVFAFCLGLGSVLMVSGSKGMEKTQLPPVRVADNHQSSPEGNDGVSGVLFFAQVYLDMAKKFLKDKNKPLQEWILEILSKGYSHEIPRVIIDLPPATPEGPKTDEPQSEQVMKPIVHNGKVAPSSETTPVSIEPNYTVATRALLLEKSKVEDGLKQEAPEKLKKPVLISVQAQKETEKKTEKKINKISKEQVQGKMAVAPVPTGVGLMLGLSLKLGMAHQANKSSCIIKKNDYVHFCVQAINWPAHIRAQFKTNGSLHKETQAISRYDDKKLTHTHATFFETGLKDVISYLKDRYGPPIEVLHNIVTPFEGRPRDNPTFIWRKNEPVLNKSINVTLEVRKFDDVGGGFPDMKHGFIRLYGDDSLPIFPQVSKRELMLVKYLAQEN